MRPRVHTTFELLTLDFIGTLLEMKKKESATKCSEKQKNCESSVWKYLRNIFENEQPGTGSHVSFTIHV